MLKPPGTMAVPVIAPLEVLSVRPAGSVPRTENAKGGRPPLTAIGRPLKATPTSPELTVGQVMKVGGGGGGSTVMPAVAVLPAPPVAERTVTKLVCGPGTNPSTFTEKAQVAPAARAAALRLMVADLDTAAMVPP